MCVIIQITVIHIVARIVGHSLANAGIFLGGCQGSLRGEIIERDCILAIARCYLRALELFDDQLEPVDLTLVLVNDGRHVAHKAMQQSRIRRKIVEIELHDESYANTLIRSSNFALFHAGFCIFSASERGLPCALRRAPVDAFDQHRELRRRERYRAARFTQRGPDESALL